MKLRIHSDGETTTVFDEHGNDVSSNVYKIEWSHGASGMPEAMITFRDVALDYVGEARVAVQAIVSEKHL